MSSSKYQTKYKSQLIKIYQKINKSNAQYISVNDLKLWIQMVWTQLSIEGISDNQDFKSDIKQNFQDMVNDYLKQVHTLEPQNIKDPSFKYEQCIQFLDWITNQNGNQNQYQQTQEQEYKKEQQAEYQAQQQNNIANQQPQREQSIKNNSNNYEKSITANKSLIKNQSNVIKNQSNVIKNKSNVKQSIQAGVEKHVFQVKQHLIQRTHNSVGIQIPKEMGRKPFFPQLQSCYKQYLQVIFQHYCKISYATGQDPTFQSISKRISIMTINKFMVFCKEFQFNQLVSLSVLKDQKDKPNKVNIRNLLMELFKKNAQCYKEMNYQQFQQTLRKLAQMSFHQMKEVQKPQNIIESEKLPFQMVKLLDYMQISTPKDFKDKMNKFHINHLVKTSKQQQKKVPLNYKFKYQPNENLQLPQSQPQPLLYNKAAQQKSQHAAVQLSIRAHKAVSKTSQQKIKPLSNSVEKPQFDKQKATNSTKNLSKNNQRQNLVLNNLPINQNKKNLGPVVLPVRKISNQSTPSIPTINVLTGYAKIHLAKKGLLQEVDITHQLPPSVSRKKGDFQLNNIVEEARNIVYYDNQSRSNRALSNSNSMRQPPSIYSRQSSYQQNVGNDFTYQRNLQNDLQNNLLSHKSPPIRKLYNQQNSVDNSRMKLQNQLGGLIDLNDSDEDQYLQQHLKKQKTTQFNSRIDKKISLLSNSRKL